VIRVRATDVPGAPTPVSVSDDWTFEATGLVGSQRLTAGAPDGGGLRSIRWNGRDVTDRGFDVDGDVTGIEVLLTRQVTTLAGFVRDDRGQPAPDATVVIFAEDAAKWPATSRYIRRMQSDQSGGFTTRGLPPGRYVAVALPADSLESGEETNPDTLERLARTGTRVTLGDGETRSVDLRIASAP
jgi:hypothetical protein